MNSLKTHITIALGLGGLSLVGCFFLHLALTDIHHGEPDLTLEWRVVQVSVLLILVFITTAMFALRRALRPTS